MPCGGRSVTGTPWQWLWIEMAAWWPCATAQMMFLGPQRRVAAEEDAGRVDCMVRLVDHRHVPLVELDAQVALDPGERVLLPDGQDHIVGGQENRVDHLRFPRALVPFQALELHAL